MKAELTKVCLFKSTDKAKQLVYGVVLEPNSEDAQGDIITADEIEKTAHDYMIRSQVLGDRHAKVGGELLKANAVLVESFISPCDMLIGVEQVLKGSWVVGAKVNDPNMWADIESGELTGFSIGGFGERVEIDGDTTE